MTAIVPDWILAALKAAALGWLAILWLGWMVGRGQPLTRQGRWLRRFTLAYLVAGGLMGTLAVTQQAQYLASRGVIPLDFRPLFPVFIAGVIMWPVELGVIITSHQY